MGLELQQNLKKSVIHVFYLLENVDNFFSQVFCDKNSTNGASFFDSI